MHLTIKTFEAASAERLQGRTSLPGREDAYLTVGDFQHASWMVRDWCEDNEVGPGEFAATLTDWDNKPVGEVRHSGLVVGLGAGREAPVLFDPAQNPRRPVRQQESERIQIHGLGAIEVSGTLRYVHLRGVSGRKLEHTRRTSENLDKDGKVVWDSTLWGLSNDDAMRVAVAVDAWVREPDTLKMLARNEIAEAEDQTDVLEREAYKLQCKAERLRAQQRPHDERRWAAQHRLRVLEEEVAPAAPTP